MARSAVAFVAAVAVFATAFAPRRGLPARPRRGAAAGAGGAAHEHRFPRRLEDPEKVLNQAVDDLQKDLVTIRQSYAEVMATQKRMQRQKDQADQLADEWYKRAQLALEKGDDELAREALSRKTQQTDASAGLDEQIATATKVNDMLSDVGGSSSMDAFERMKEKVEMLETQAEVSGQLQFGASTADMESKFKALEAGSAVDDELSAMKRQLTAGSDAAPEAKALPATPGEAAVEDERAKMKKAAEGN
ncbi:hypothetical protein JL721_5854 [Aureococcus anophagefferens]|nr:hypothetical protein JL721_5854 [Aureococcus anophagefferens]